MLRAAERADEVIFAATVKSALPDPEPLLLVATTQAAVLEDVQEQPAPAVTVIARLPPATDMDGAVGETVKEHGAPSWLTVSVSPPIVSDPARPWPEVLAAALNETVPLPVPLASPVTVNQPVLLVAVHAHPVVALTEVDDAPPVAATVRLVGDSVTSHAEPACVIVKGCPATSSVPVLASAVVFAAAVNVTEPLPVPLAPPVTVSHDVLLLTPVHAHPAGDVTPVEPVPPPAGTEPLAAESVNVQAMPGCVTLKLCPAIVSVPVRELVLLLAAALNATVPLPVPLAPPVTVSQDVLLLTPVHAHPASDVTPVEPVPPPAGTEPLAAESVNVQAMPGCVTLKLCPAIVSVPVRGLMLLLAAALNATVPLPCRSRHP